MKKPAVNYRHFRLRRINEPAYSHLKLLLGWPVYFLLYFLTERFIPAQNCRPVHCFLDDRIPFCEWFFLPYVSWYLVIAGSLIYFLLYHVNRFRQLQTYFIITQAIATLIYILFPTRQDLRPAVFPRENVLTACTAFLYRIDTSTGVCPSLHVADSIALASVWLREKSVSPVFKAFLTVFLVLVCLSTMFLKQHSAVDFFAAIPVCLIAEAVIFGFPTSKRLH